MKPWRKNIIAVIAGLLFFSHGGLAQQGLYVPDQGKIFFTGDSAAIFSDVFNYGKFGIGKNAVVNFLGNQWSNEWSSQITDNTDNGLGVNGIGGTVRFMGSSAQYLNGGYNAAAKSGPTFSKLIIQNASGVFLSSGTSKVRDELMFAQGHLFLQNNLLVVGNRNPGKILGFDSTKFIVTANSPGSGFLIREHIANRNGLIVFPIGTGVDEYTPAAVFSRSSEADDYYVTVFDQSRANFIGGQMPSGESVGKIWQIGKSNPEPGVSTDIFLQHLNRQEGDVFRTNRSRSYVAHYSKGNWDIADNTGAPEEGGLVTGTALKGSGLNSRTFNTSALEEGFFTKHTIKDTAKYKNRIWFSAYRIDWNSVSVHWTTKPEFNNRYFIVQRRYSNESGFRNIDTVMSKAPNGLSLEFLKYEIIDPNDYRGITYYRLIMVDYAGGQTFTHEVPVGGKPGGNGVLVWPNPSTGKFKVGITDYAVIKTIVIWDILGQKVLEEPVRERAIIDLQLTRPGTYIVGFISESRQVLETKKLLILPWE